MRPVHLDERHLGLGVWGLGFRVWGLGFGVGGCSRFGVWRVGFRFWGVHGYLAHKNPPSPP